MGGFLMGLLGGAGKAIHEQNLLQMQKRAQQQKATIDFLQGMAQLPGVESQAANQFLNLAMQTQTTDPAKFKPNKVGEQFFQIVGDYHQRAQSKAKQEQAAKVMATVAPLVTPGFAGVPAESPESQVAQFVAQRPEAIPLQPPMQLVDPLRAAQATAAAERTKFGAQYGAQAEAKTAALQQEVSALVQAGFDPKTAMVVALGHQPPKPEAPFMHNVPEGATVLGPKGEVILQGRPKSPTTTAEERLQNVAARTVAQSAGLKLDESQGDLLAQLPINLQTQAVKLHEELKKTRNPELEALTRLGIQQRRMEIDRLKEARGPEATQAWVDMIKRDPDVWFDKALDEAKVRGPVGRAWTAQTGMPVPRKLGPEMKRAEETSEIALQHYDAVVDLLKDPVILQRLGPILGRLGNLEQAVGDTAGLSTQDAEKVQRFRTSLNYFFFREGRALLGGRPAERLMQEFGKTSANVAMALPLIKGSLEGAKSMAQATLDSAQRYRFGGRQAPTAGASRPPVADTARVKSPDGKIGTIPRRQLEAAKRQGYVEVQ